MCIHLYSVNDVTLEFLCEIFRIKGEKTLDVLFFTMVDCTDSNFDDIQLNVLQLGEIKGEIKNQSRILLECDDKNLDELISNLNIFSAKPNGNGSIKLSYKTREFDAKVMENNDNIRLCPNDEEHALMMKELDYIPMSRVALNGFTKGEKWLVGIQYEVEVPQPIAGKFKIRGPVRAYKECGEIFWR